MNLPKPECRWGYTNSQINEILGDRVDDFTKWMTGQTMSICEGKAYNHKNKEYVEVCNGIHHGVVVFPWDLERFLRK